MAKFKEFFVICYLFGISLASGSLVPEGEISFTEDLMVPFFFRKVLEKLSSADSRFTVLREGVSDTCAQNTNEWLYQVTGFLNGTAPDLWALQMLDAWAKPPEGILSGHFNPMGDFDECINIKATQDEPIEFVGKYCTVHIIPVTPNASTEGKFLENVQTPKESLSPTDLLELAFMTGGIQVLPSVGTCYPSSCSDKDIEILSKNALELLGLNNTIQTIVTYCTVKEKPAFDGGDITMMVILGVLFGTCLMTAVMDIWIHRGIKKNSTQGAGMQLLFSFSLYSNIKKWLSTRPSGDNLGCVHGIRFFTTLWVVLTHTWYPILFMPHWNMVDVKLLHEDWPLMLMFNASLSVDTFFVLSGMLVSYNLLQQLQRSKGRLNLPMFYIHRYLRITPTYAILIGVMATVVPYLGSGPFWGIIESWSYRCEINWWTNLLYINNFVETKNLCHGEAWYLATDMQFFILSPLFIYPLWRWRKIGFGLLGISTVASILVPAIQVYFQDNIAPALILTRVQPGYLVDLYIKPYSRIQTYFVGIALGYLLFLTRGKNIRIPKIAQYIGWSLSTGISLLVLFGIFPWYNPTTEIPRLEAMLYAGLGRFAFGICSSWVIFACVKGYGGLINDFLSWNVFAPLGRLCFCVYLVSVNLQMMFQVQFRQAITYSSYTMTNFFLADVFLSFLVGFICTLTMESPFIAVEKFIFQGPRKPKVENNNVSDVGKHSVHHTKNGSTIDTETLSKLEVLNISTEIPSKSEV